MKKRKVRQPSKKKHQDKGHQEHQRRFDQLLGDAIFGAPKKPKSR